MKRKSGNISILVIFVLLASSLLGVLSLNFVQQMMKQSSLIHSYYKSYYLAKAGIELWLSEISSRGVWFDQILSTGDAFFSGNFLCGKNCNLSLSISWTSSSLTKKFWLDTGCQYPYMLSWWESFALPLFADATPWSVVDMFTTGIVYENITDVFHGDNIEIENVSDISSDNDIIFWVLILSGQDVRENGMYVTSGTLDTASLIAFRKSFEEHIPILDSMLTNYFSDTFIANGHTMYLLISNATDTQQSFCIHSTSSSLTVAKPLPADTFFFQSVGSYGNQQAALDASYAQPIPGYLFSSYSQ